MCGSDGTDGSPAPSRRLEQPCAQPPLPRPAFPGVMPSAGVPPVMEGHRERGVRVAALIVCMATRGYDDADEAYTPRLWEVDTGTVPLLHQAARDA
jgi:hypothetical protein